ncbi:MAG: thioredoxin-dependent thiol peroxidase [Alphaproteobacteria bacterium]|nr:MAG: thioredoxin-dependent thiol peroxidase [Alphaproteobacteria bacterium]
MTIDIGDAAPAFALPGTLPGGGGGEIALSDYAGKAVVLYFYPKDMTPGCTIEAIDFSALAGEFDKAGAVVIGVSKDSPARHDKFCEKHGLKIRLVSDTDGTLCDAYGAWKQKSMYGRTFMGIERTTFLINDRGELQQIWRKVKVKNHAAEVLAVVQGL